MQAIKSSYQDKLEQLSSIKLKIEYQLRNDTDKGWGEDAIIWRQSLLDELVKVERDILNIQDAMTREQNNPTYLVEVNGTVKSIKVVPQELVSPREGMISIDSPLAKALEGTSAGKEIELATPGGTQKYKVIQA